MHQIKISLGDAIFVVLDKRPIKISNEWIDTTHFHASYEIHLVFNGNATIEIDGEDYTVYKNDICFLTPNISHYPKSTSDYLEKTSFSFTLSRNYGYHKDGKDFSEYVYYENIFKAIKGHQIINEPKICQIILDMITEEKNELTEHFYTALFSEFFLKLALIVKNEQGLVGYQTTGDDYENENTLKKRKIVEEFFQNRYAEQIKIDDLAKELCLSVPQTHRIVKKIFGVGFKKILTKQRITHAKMLIKNGKDKLFEIAEKCGYSSYNGFLSAFKSFTKISPKDYEKNLKQEN